MHLNEKMCRPWGYLCWYEKIQLIHFEWKKDVQGQGSTLNGKDVQAQGGGHTCVGTKKQELCWRGSCVEDILESSVFNPLMDFCVFLMMFDDKNEGKKPPKTQS
jgi:hypothetical protein